MDELFGEVGFAHADLETKARIELEIGLTALIGGEEQVSSIDNFGKTKFMDITREEFVEK